MTLKEQILTNCGQSCNPNLACTDCLTQILLELAQYADNSPQQWFSEYQQRYSATGNVLTTLYQEQLPAFTFYVIGSFFKFSYLINIVNYENTNDIYVMFSNQDILSIASAQHGLYWITGTVKMLNLRGLKASYKIQYTYNNTITSPNYGILSNINFDLNQKLILQGQGTAFGDVTGYEGEGVTYSIPYL